MVQDRQGVDRGDLSVAVDVRIVPTAAVRTAGPRVFAAAAESIPLHLVQHQQRVDRRDESVVVDVRGGHGILQRR